MAEDIRTPMTNSTIVVQIMKIEMGMIKFIVFTFFYCYAKSEIM